MDITNFKLMSVLFFDEKNQRVKPQSDVNRCFDTATSSLISADVQSRNFIFRLYFNMEGANHPITAGVFQTQSCLFHSGKLTRVDQTCKSYYAP